MHVLKNFKSTIATLDTNGAQLAKQVQLKFFWTIPKNETKKIKFFGWIPLTVRMCECMCVNAEMQWR